MLLFNCFLWNTSWRQEAGGPDSWLHLSPFLIAWMAKGPPTSSPHVLWVPPNKCLGRVFPTCFYDKVLQNKVFERSVRPWRMNSVRDGCPDLLTQSNPSSPGKYTGHTWTFQGDCWFSCEHVIYLRGFHMNMPTLAVVSWVLTGPPNQWMLEDLFHKSQCSTPHGYDTTNGHSMPNRCRHT